MAKRSRFRPSLKRVRTWCVVAAVVLCLMIGASARWVFRASYAQQASAGKGARIVGFMLQGGAVELYGTTDVQASDWPSTPGFDFNVDRRWQDDVTLAWRPYHIAVTPGFAVTNTHHGFVLPLWLVAAPVTIAAAYLQGVVSGLKRADKGRCVGCGYSRAGLAAGAACPECGKVDLPQRHRDTEKKEAERPATD